MKIKLVVEEKVVYDAWMRKQKATFAKDETPAVEDGGAEPTTETTPTIILN